MEKEFRRIPMFPKYLISDNGTVISTRSGHIRKQKQNYQGYMEVGMFSNKKRRNFKVHRLVCMAFHGMEDSFLSVNHKNGNRSDNRVENLEWCTTSHNNYHSFSVNKRPLPKSLLKGGENSKACLVTKGNVIGNFASVTEAAHANNIAKHILLRIVNGKKTLWSDRFEAEFI